ncbi:Scr1 family TA system antitoxin-like transcriptional regulator [Streptosporangium canum]|uniref:Scr1 family TA system antitoxin-like transcriptional regulator n=1 Tax=Streptosporangium canum TaxID=324952 RepID=UPI00343C303E
MTSTWTRPPPNPRHTITDPPGARPESEWTTALGAGFHVFRFGSNDQDVVYIEYPTGTIYLEKQPEVERYTLIFDYLRAAALPAKASRKLITQMANELGDQ